MCARIRMVSIAVSALLGAAGLPHAGAETLEQAWQMATTADLALAAAQSDVEAADSDSAAARAQRWPTLMASGGYTQMNDSPAFDFSTTGLPVQLPEIFDDDNFSTAGVNVSLPLFTSGRISSQIQAADAAKMARQAEVTRTSERLKLAVAEHYVGLMRAQRNLAVADSNVAMLAGYARDVESMFNRETVPRNDLLSAQVALANARQARLQAANAVELARAAYNRRLGQPLERYVELEPLPESVVAELAQQPVETLIERASASRAELLGLESQAASLGHAADAERSRVLPQVRLTAGYTYFENEALDREDFSMAGVEFQWTLFDGGQAGKRSGSLRHSRRAVEQRREDMRSYIALEVRDAWFKVREAAARMNVTRDAVEQAAENLRISQQQYQAGLETSTRVLEAEALRITSRTNHDNAELDAVLARLRLAYAVGAL